MMVEEMVLPAAPDTGAQPPLTEEPSVLLMIPAVSVSFSAEWVADGCWAPFYTGDGFIGVQPSVAGSAEMRSLQGPMGVRWTGLETALVGPRAGVPALGEEDHSHIREPSQQALDAEERRGSRWFGICQDFKSLPVTCCRAVDPAHGSAFGA